MGYFDGLTDAIFKRIETAIRSFIHGVFSAKAECWQIQQKPIGFAASFAITIL
jgi:hypothetical protein